MTQGYILFKVNNKYFLSYKKAREFSIALRRKGISNSFKGFHLCNFRWEMFYLEVHNPEIIPWEGIIEEEKRCKKYFMNAEL